MEVVSSVHFDRRYIKLCVVLNRIVIAKLLCSIKFDSRMKVIIRLNFDRRFIKLLCNIKFRRSIRCMLCSIKFWQHMILKYVMCIKFKPNIKLNVVLNFESRCEFISTIKFWQSINELLLVLNFGSRYLTCID
jgi:hypothetical protein